MNSFNPGHVIRNYPLKDGSFDTFEIREIHGDVLTVYNTREICEAETWRLSEVELFSFTGNCGTYEIGDKVRAMGYEGTWTVEHFAQDYRSSSQGEWSVSLLHENGRTRLFYPAHYAKKA